MVALLCSPRGVFTKSLTKRNFPSCEKLKKERVGLAVKSFSSFPESSKKITFFVVKSKQAKPSLELAIRLKPPASLIGFWGLRAFSGK